MKYELTGDIVVICKECHHELAFTAADFTSFHVLDTIQQNSDERIVEANCYRVCPICGVEIRVRARAIETADGKFKRAEIASGKYTKIKENSLVLGELKK